LLKTLVCLFFITRLRGGVFIPLELPSRSILQAIFSLNSLQNVQLVLHQIAMET
jgi:hypothetical protein